MPPAKKNKGKRSINHSSVRRYACGQCPRECSSPGNLRRHLTIHSGEKPFECPTCRTSFTRADNFQRHRNNVHKISHELTPLESSNQTAADEHMATSTSTLNTSAQGSPSIRLASPSNAPINNPRQGTLTMRLTGRVPDGSPKSDGILQIAQEGSTNFMSKAVQTCDVEESELDCYRPSSDPGRLAEEPSDYSTLDPLQNLDAQNANTSDVASQDPEEEQSSPRPRKRKFLPAITEHMMKFLNSIEPVNGMEVNGEGNTLAPVLVPAERRSTTTESNKHRNQVSVVACIDTDLEKFNKLQNSTHCGTHMEVTVFPPSSVTAYFQRSGVRWKTDYPGCRYSQEEERGHRFGMIEVCPQTIRPFEVFGTLQPTFIWVLKGEIVLKTNTIEVMGKEGNQVPVLRDFIFKEGDPIVIPADVPHCFVNKTHQVVHLGYSYLYESYTALTPCH